MPTLGSLSWIRLFKMFSDLVIQKRKDFYGNKTRKGKKNGVSKQEAQSSDDSSAPAVSEHPERLKNSSEARLTKRLLQTPNSSDFDEDPFDEPFSPQEIIKCRAPIAPMGFGLPQSTIPRTRSQTAIPSMTTAHHVSQVSRPGFEHEILEFECLGSREQMVPPQNASFRERLSAGRSRGQLLSEQKCSSDELQERSTTRRKDDGLQSKNHTTDAGPRRRQESPTSDMSSPEPAVQPPAASKRTCIVKLKLPTRAQLHARESVATPRIAALRHELKVQRRSAQSIRGSVERTLEDRQARSGSLTTNRTQPTPSSRTPRAVPMASPTPPPVAPNIARPTVQIAAQVDERTSAPSRQPEPCIATFDAMRSQRQSTFEPSPGCDDTERVVVQVQYIAHRPMQILPFSGYGDVESWFRCVNHQRPTLMQKEPIVSVSVKLQRPTEDEIKEDSETKVKIDYEITLAGGKHTFERMKIELNRLLSAIDPDKEIELLVQPLDWPAHKLALSSRALSLALPNESTHPVPESNNNA